jgi:tRNA A-37 threonylcarbamoyl transferase component Bud32
VEELQPGAEFDRYRVEAVLGRGGTATVFKVRHRTLGTQRALKVLHVSNIKMQERLTQEARILSALEHPNIVRVIDALEIQGMPGVLMEFVDGAPLDRQLAEGKLPLDQAEEVFLGILAAVERAHKAGIIHRDLKPANVLLSREDGKLVPKVADFGIAKIVAEVDSEASLGSGQRLTKTGSAMGTPAYMAPEQIRDAANVDQRADIFALGCILYELVTGHLAFEAPDWLQTFNAISDGRYRSPREWVPDLPARIELAIRFALARDVEDRAKDCAALRATLASTATTLTPDDSRRGPAPSADTFATEFQVDLQAPAQSRRRLFVLLSGGALGMGAVVASVLVMGRPGSEIAAPSELPPVASVAAPAAAPAEAVAPPEFTFPATGTISIPTPVTVEPLEPAAPVEQAAPRATPPKPSTKAPTRPAATASAPAVASSPPPGSAAGPQGTGKITVKGASEVTVQDAAKKSVGRSGLPAGTYTVIAKWGERSARASVELSDGGSATVECDEMFGECSVK